MALLHTLESTPVHHDALWEKSIQKRFCRKQQNDEAGDDVFFSQFWQGFAWAAIIGFLNNKRIPLDTKTKNSSFRFGTIRRQGPEIADGLILMAIAKSNKGADILEDEVELVNIMSEYAKGGASIIDEIRETPGTENKFDFPDDFLAEIEDRIVNEVKQDL